MEKEESRFPENPKSWTEEEKIQLLEKNRGLLYSFVLPTYRILSGKDAAWGVEDYMQVASIAFLKAMDTYSPTEGCRFTTYAGYVIKRDLKDIRRKIYAEKRKRPEEAWEQEHFYEEEQEGGKTGEGSERGFFNPVEEAVLRKDFYREVAEMLKNFSEKEQRIFWLLSQKIRTQTELAKEYGCSQSNISLEYRRVREILKERLQER